ncbi:MAG: Rne/Rng family ribonuclease [candidate division Zixibacteria bacterium]|nr:Rne/Rng family ribonuclease [candidate division Zixibacteria bacterium]
MQKDIIINSTEYETRIAILEDSKLMELWVERPEKERMVGDIYKGIVKAVLPGMQAAFLELGLEKNAFLHISDITELYEADFSEEESAQRTRVKSRKNIEEVLKKGQELLVQIMKEPIGTKGPKVTSQLSLAGRCLVLVPGEEHIGVSRKIAEREEKKRLREAVSGIKPEGFGVIIRTIAEGKVQNELKNDFRFLLKLWSRIKKEAEKKKAPSLVHKDMGMITSVIRDQLSPEVNQVLIDSKWEFKKMRSSLRVITPALRQKVILYDKEIPIFDYYNVENQIEKMLDRKVWLRRGAHIVIDQTEAMVTIDVNTGRFVGRSDQHATILRTNLEAAREIARQIRLRDIGGLIIVDFIDMYSPEDRRKVFEEFRTSFRNDRSKHSFLPISDFGLIEMTRERIRPSLLYTFSEPCPACDGAGRILSRETLASKIERWFKRAKTRSVDKRYKLLVNPEVFKVLTEGRGGRINKLCKMLRLEIYPEKDESLPVDEFKIFSLDEEKEVTERFKA